MSADKNAAVSMHASAASSQAHPGKRNGDRVALAGYGAAAGIVTSAAGAAVSSGLSGGPRISVWIGVTAVLAICAVWLAEPTVTVLSRWNRPAGRGRQ
jgi:hypothetical protein